MMLWWQRYCFNQAFPIYRYLFIAQCDRQDLVKRYCLDFVHYCIFVTEYFVTYCWSICCGVNALHFMAFPPSCARDDESNNHYWSYLTHNTHCTLHHSHKMRNVKTPKREVFFRLIFGCIAGKHLERCVNSSGLTFKKDLSPDERMPFFEIMMQALHWKYWFECSTNTLQEGQIVALLSSGILGS